MRKSVEIFTLCWFINVINNEFWARNKKLVILQKQIPQKPYKNIENTNLFTNWKSLKFLAKMPHFFELGFFRVGVNSIHLYSEFVEDVDELDEEDEYFFFRLDLPQCGNSKFFPPLQKFREINLDIISHSNSLCSRHFQNVKLRLDFVEIWSFYHYSDFTWNQI